MYIRETLSLCPVCRDVIKATLIAKNNDVYMEKTCNLHGAFNYLYWKDYSLFKEIDKIIDKDICRDPICIRNKPCVRHLKKTICILIDITNRCNYSCPVCYSDANILFVPEPSPKEVYDRLPEGKRKKPTVVLIGGEPTLRDDLPKIISAVIQKGYIPRLSTNGSRLLDENYVKKLKSAGLNRILLQFDGFSDNVYQKLRGGKLSDFKRKIILNLTKHNFRIQLLGMIVKDINDSEVGKIIEFAIKEKNISWVRFYAFSQINKNLLNIKEETHMSDMINIIERETKGKIRRRDFLNTMRFWSFLYKLTGELQFKQKLTMFPMVLIIDKNNYYPINKFLNPIFAFKKLKLCIKILLSLKKIINFDKSETPFFILYLVIEKFHTLETIDLYETSKCHMVFMTKNGFIPFDNFNMLREKILKRF